MDSASQTDPARAAAPPTDPGNLIVVSGPSGVGKGTLVNRLLKLAGPRVVRSISCTTRPPRSGEQDGVDYFFVAPQVFHDKVADHEFLEHARYGSHCYGTPRRFVEEMLGRGQDVILVIEVQGALQIQHARADAVFVFISPPSMDELANRLAVRDTESAAAIQERLAIARQEMEHLWHYDYEVVNDEVDAAVDKLRAIIIAERCRIQAQLPEGET